MNTFNSKITTILILLSISVLLAGCPGVGENVRCFDPKDGDLGASDPEKAIRYERLLQLGAKPATEYFETNGGNERIGQIRQGLALVRERVWENRRIPVCWEDSTFRAGDEAQRRAVRDQVSRTWERALDFKQILIDRGESVSDQWNDLYERQSIRFVGWTRCSQGNNTGIRINVSDSGPKVTALGSDLAGKRNGMQLNFDFNNWSEGCSTSAATRESCSRWIAVHEFGHALGFTHEQNRSDAQLEAHEHNLSQERCLNDQEQRQGTDPNTNIGELDVNSVMSYCSSVWNNGGMLTPMDIAAARLVYFPEMYEEYVCIDEQKFRRVVNTSIEELERDLMAAGLGALTGGPDRAMHAQLFTPSEREVFQGHKGDTFDSSIQTQGRHQGVSI